MPAEKDMNTLLCSSMFISLVIKNLHSSFCQVLQLQVSMDSSNLLLAQIQTEISTDLAGFGVFAFDRNAYVSPLAYGGSPSSKPQSPGVTQGKRRRFNRERKKEVASMRKIGACMPCHLRKVAVSRASSLLDLLS